MDTDINRQRQETATGKEKQSKCNKEPGAKAVV